jgi:hypothetical protein
MQAFFDTPDEQLESNVVKTPEQERQLAADARAHWFTIVFDREAYSPELFEQMPRSALPS